MTMSLQRLLQRSLILFSRWQLCTVYVFLLLFLYWRLGQLCDHRNRAQSLVTTCNLVGSGSVSRCLSLEQVILLHYRLLTTLV